MLLEVGDSLRIDDHTILKVLRIGKNKIRLGIEAPPSVTVARKEIWEQYHTSSEAKDNHRACR